MAPLIVYYAWEPVHVPGWRYLGNRLWEKKKEARGEGGGPSPVRGKKKEDAEPK